MKKNLLYLYTNASEHLIPFLRQEMEEITRKSISREVYQKGDIREKIKEANERLFSGMDSKLRSVAIIALNNLRDIYKHNGIDPTHSDSGYYNMLRFLDEIGELIISVTSDGWHVN
ncbi:MAG: hypothetical protein KBB75_00810 [Candidatus Pacebacteria bacterium]|jgi:hypothetical protein|nr:hypothetical protein [Candidatus Paceibacterota bacterium]